ncbi:MAG: aminotransferase class I/II-fold pyridoxal phosphate-dependent enzyme [Ruminococcaceae bacterium]|nr:aminotransferase class I/II-fold pyridoxal phosphate-dependent enzyme [Oscillospiraceae bacterium]
MNTPIADFIDSYIESNSSRFHMPGHKGVGEIEKYDITEISGADVLYSADGIINESENSVSKLFGTEHSYYCTEGSTLAIKAMLALVSKGTSKTILAARNVHKAFVYGCALLDLSVEWLYPKDYSHLCACSISAEDVRSALAKTVEKPCAVYITSPDYLGNIADISGISKVCREAGVPLLVDNAHGAYLNFLEHSLHPIALGAAMCADSAHKTLPVLTGGAYLHVSKDHPEFVKGARSALSLFASTSPSYLIMRSLDLCNKYMAECFKSELSDCVAKTDACKKELADMGISVEASEPCKIVVNAEKMGYSGDALGDILRSSGVEAEFCDCEYVVLMTSPRNTDEDFEKVLNAFQNIEHRESIAPFSITPAYAKQVMSIREATFAENELVPVEKAIGRVCASPSVSCPPAVPIAVSGELIGETEISLFKRYGIGSIEVVK